MKLHDCAAAFGALADETRLRILNLLQTGELCVCDLMKVLREPQSKISRHLGHLRRADFVRARKRGLWMHYRLSGLAGSNGIFLKAFFSSGRRSERLKRDLRALQKSKRSLVGCC